MTCGRKIGNFDCCSVVQGDCLELMKSLPDGCVDAVITDPPYGVDFRGNGWDSHIPSWFDMCRPLAKSCFVITGATTIWQYPEADWVLCWYRPASNSLSKVGGFSHWSPILVYGEPKFPIDCLSLHAIHHRAPDWNEHPTPKPDALLDWLVRYGSGETQTVFDPFLGSGTTAISAKKLGRHFLGFEISEEYCKIARERLERIDAQPNLFERKAEQMEVSWP